MKIGYGYTNLGAVGSISYPSGRLVTYGFDPLGRATSVTSSLNGAIHPSHSGQFLQVVGYSAKDAEAPVLVQDPIQGIQVLAGTKVHLRRTLPGGKRVG
jgi:hypothetical protein